jgi:gibberellin 3-beta-dioxygenase
VHEKERKLISVIDLSDGSEGEIAEKVIAQLKVNGILRLRNHGVPAAAIANAFEVAKVFFSQTAEEKNAAISKDRARRGYSPLSSENFASLVGEQMKNDSVEKFRIGPNSVGDDEYYSTKMGRVHFSPNIWPRNVEGMQTVMETYYLAMEKFVFHLMGIIERGLKVERDYFRGKLFRHTSILGLNYFPPHENPVEDDDDEKIRIAAHTDVSLFTVLTQQEVQGLEVFCKMSKTWVPIPADDDVLVVNVGDCLSDWLLGSFPSTLHRVKDCEKRLSIAFFVQPEYDALIGSKDTHRQTFHEWRQKKIKDAMRLQRKHGT